MGDQTIFRKDHSSNIRNAASTHLRARIGEWVDADNLASRLSIYTTGSFGRGDACIHSDLDIFIVTLKEEVTDRRLLTRLEEIELLASIVHVNRQLSLPPLDGDGGFLKVHTLDDYLVGLGRPDDDANNTFTGRLLLMLESKPIFGEVVYNHIMRECIQRYWIDFAGHKDSFLPAFLMNDILRFWRTLCVNYEAGEARDPAKRRAKNFKLKFSRLLTCFSALIGLQAEFERRGTVTSDNALEILSTSPLQRLADANDKCFSGRSEIVTDLFGKYEWFLAETDCKKYVLYQKMEDPEYYRETLGRAREFGDRIYDLINAMPFAEGTEGRRFVRYLTV